MGILMAASKCYGELNFILYCMSSRSWMVIFYLDSCMGQEQYLICQLYVLCRFPPPLQLLFFKREKLLNLLPCFHSSQTATFLFNSDNAMEQLTAKNCWVAKLAYLDVTKWFVDNISNSWMVYFKNIAQSNSWILEFQEKLIIF